MLSLPTAWNNCVYPQEPACPSLLSVCDPWKAAHTQPTETWGLLGCIWAKAQGADATKPNSGPESLQICCILWGNGISGAPDSMTCPCSCFVPFFRDKSTEELTFVKHFLEQESCRKDWLLLLSRGEHPLGCVLEVAQSRTSMPLPGISCLGWRGRRCDDPSTQVESQPHCQI